MPARVNEQYIAILHIRTFLDIFGPEKSHIIEHVAEVNDDAWTVTPFNRDLVNGLAFGHKMTRCIEVRAHMVRCLDILRVDPMLRFAFDVLHFKRRVEGPEG